VGVIAFQVPVKVKLGSESSTVILLMEPLARTGRRRTIKECGSHISASGQDGGKRK
jgi:hypothetical protein